MTDGVSAAYRDSISVTDLIPKRIWVLARDIVVENIDWIITNAYRNPDDLRRVIRVCHNMELSEQELRFLTYALHYIRLKLYETIR